MLLGLWKSIDELEDNISLPELNALLIAYEKQRSEDRKFAAALKGIKLDDEEQESVETRWERVAARADAALAGVSEEEQSWADLGIKVKVVNNID